MHGFISGLFYFVPLIYISVFVPVPYCLDDCSFVVEPEVRQVDSSISSFPIWIPFIYFSSLIAVAKTSKTMLNSSGESGHPCLVPDFRGNAFNFSPLRIMFAVGLSHMV